jgi:hypothetical protein
MCAAYNGVEVPSKKADTDPDPLLQFLQYECSRCGKKAADFSEHERAPLYAKALLWKLFGNGGRSMELEAIAGQLFEGLNTALATSVQDDLTEKVRRAEDEGRVSREARDSIDLQQRSAEAGAAYGLAQPVHAVPTRSHDDELEPR